MSSSTLRTCEPEVGISNPSSILQWDTSTKICVQNSCRSSFRIEMVAERPPLDISGFPPGTVTEYTTLVCLACIFDIFTKQIGLAPRYAYSEIKRYTPSIEELTSRKAVRPFFDSDEKRPHCPYCDATKRWHARLDTAAIEGGKPTDTARRALNTKLQKKTDLFSLLEMKSDRRTTFFDWLDTLRISVDLTDKAWLLDSTKAFLARRRAK